MLKKKYYKKKIPKKKQPKNKNKNKNKNIIKVNVNTSTNGGSGGSTIPYPIYPVSQQMFPTNSPPNIYNVFTKDPVKSNYEPQNENTRETENVRETILVPSDDGITFSENNEVRSINFDDEPTPNLRSQLVARTTPVRLREEIRQAVGEDNEDKERRREYLRRQAVGEDNEDNGDKERRREYLRIWRERNPDKVREYNARSRQNKNK